MIHLRRAVAMDAGAMSALLNDIISIGGTTAMTRPVTADDMVGRLATNADKSAWHIAEDDKATLLGFQWIAPHPDLPPAACDIATFVRHGQTGVGIGSRLFDATRDAARALGYDWINATIRADNSGGLAYYQSRGFEDNIFLRDVRLANGQVVDKLCKRYDLRA